MGCPEKYYKKSLQKFAFTMNHYEDKLKATRLLNNDDIDLLEKEILTKKNEMTEREFYFEAGRIYELVLNEADENDGCDGLNACISGLGSFMSFVGVEDED